MKIVVRKSVFETNSSSNHSLIITNSKEFNEENEKMKNEIKKWTSGIVYPKILDTKEDKVYMLGAFFDWVQKEGYSSYDDEYEVFIQVLKDNNDEELIKNLEINGKDYLSGEDDEPYCTNYFWEGTLSGCYCGFDNYFRTYFKNFKYETPEEYKEKLYNKFKEFIYGDGIIATYGYI